MKFTEEELKYLSSFFEFHVIDEGILVKKDFIKENEESVKKYHPNTIRRVRGILREFVKRKYLSSPEDNIEYKTPFEDVFDIYDFQNPRVQIILTLRQRLVKSLRKITFDSPKSKDSLELLYNMFKKNYFKSILDPCTMQGAISATCLGEISTQIVLNTFHFSGISSATVTHGLPRLTQLLELTVKQKDANMYFTTNGLNKYETFIFAKSIEELYMNDLFLKDIDTLPDFITNRPRKDSFYIDFFKVFSEGRERKELFDWSVRLHFDYKKLCIYNIELETLSDMIMVILTNNKIANDVMCVYSTNEEGIIDVYVDTDELPNPEEIIEKEEKKKTRKKNQDIGFLQNNKEKYFLHDIIYLSLCDIRVNGIPGIQKSFVSGEKIITNGNNIQELICRCGNLPPIKKEKEEFDMCVDFKTILSSNVWDIFNVFGIEASRQYLINEIDNALSFGGSSLHKCHIELLVDSMTHTGTLTPVNRYGSSAKTGVFAKASFEEQTKNLRKSAFRRDTDEMVNISSQIMIGEPRLGGKGFDLLVNTDMLDSIQ